jgi:hypothetical protein
MTEQYHITEINDPSDHSNNQAYEAQICCHLDRRERCRQFDIATAICEASADMPHLGDVDDNRVVQSSQLLGNYIPTYRLLICVLLSNQQ